MEVEVTGGAATFLERVGGLLLEDEARHNLVLGIASFTLDHPDVYSEVRGWVAREAGEVVGAALRTAPYNLVLARPRTPAALAALAEGITDELPGVVGAVPEVDGFASAWSARHRVTAATRFDQRIYALEELVPPRGVEGVARLAGTDDRALVLDWMTAFAHEALRGGDDAGRIERSVDARLGPEGAGGICLWEVGGNPVSLAGFGGPTPNGLRIGPGVHAARAPRARLRKCGHRRCVAGRARSRQALLLPLHRPGEPDVERDLHAARLPACVRLARDRVHGWVRLKVGSASG